MDESFGDRLKQLREQAGLTLEALAEAVESTKSYVWELENKPNIRPSAGLVYKLSVALDTTVGILMGEAAMGDLAEQDQVFFRNYQELKLDTKKRLSRIMDVLMEEDDEDEGI